MFRVLILAVAAATVAAALLPAAQPPRTDPAAITWKKTVLDRKFRSEGVAVADVNKNGQIDVLNGEYWYEAPDWTPHETPAVQGPRQPRRRPAQLQPRLLLLGRGPQRRRLPGPDRHRLPRRPVLLDGEPEGPGPHPDGKPLHWKKHTIWHSACNETPIYTDLLGNGQQVLVMGWQPKGQGDGRADGLLHPEPERPLRAVADAPDQRAERPGQGGIPAPASSATGWASATSTATAATT
jgi:hypothetical protein